MPPPKPVPTTKDRLATYLLACLYLAIVLPAAFFGIRWFINDIRTKNQIRQEQIARIQQIQAESKQYTQEHQLEELARKLSEAQQALEERPHNSPRPAQSDSQEEFMEVWAANQHKIKPFQGPRLIGYLDPQDLILPAATELEYDLKISQDGRVLQVIQTASKTNHAFPDVEDKLASAIFTPASQNSFNYSCTIHAWLHQDLSENWSIEFDEGSEASCRHEISSRTQIPDITLHFCEWQLKDTCEPVLFISQPLSYPYELKKQGIEGSVTLSFITDEYGQVSNLAVESSTPPGFEAAAIESVRQWAFLPAKKAGKPTKSKVRLPLSFKLRM